MSSNIILPSGRLVRNIPIAEGEPFLVTEFLETEFLETDFKLFTMSLSSLFSVSFLDGFTTSTDLLLEQNEKIF